MSSSGTPISSLPAAGTPLDGTEVLAGVQAGSTVKIPVSGLVLGPASSTDGHIALFNGADGNAVKDSGVAPGPYAGAALGQLPGTTTNDSAAVGKVGEYISSTVLSGAAIPLTTATAANVTFINLTAGDWDVEGQISFTTSGGSTPTTFFGWTSLVSATAPSAPNNGAFMGSQSTFPVNGAIFGPVGRQRISLAMTMTVYLGAESVFTGGSGISAFGFIGARRVR